MHAAPSLDRTSGGAVLHWCGGRSHVAVLSDPTRMVGLTRVGQRLHSRPWSPPHPRPETHRMRSLPRRVLLFGASLAAVASPLAAQWNGPIRTFESAQGCATGRLEWLFTGGIGSLPSGARFGTIFCSQVKLTVGRRSSDNYWVLRINLNTTVPEPGLKVHPLHGRGSWVDVTSSTYPTNFFGLGVLPGQIQEISVYDHVLLSNYPLENVPPSDPRSDWSHLALTGVSVWGQSTIAGWDRHPVADRTNESWVRLALVETTAPEPSTWALMTTGLLTLGGIAVRRKRSA